MTQPDATASGLSHKEKANITPAAQRALQEAAARRKLQQEMEAEKPVEIGGRDGPDPARYGDWEVKGIASDF